MITNFTYSIIPRITATFSLVLLMTLGISKHVKASHASGIEISYRYVSGTTYEFTVVFYRFCDGVAQPPSINISASSASLSIDSAGAATLLPLPTNTPGYPTSLVFNLTNCLDTAVCFEEFSYRGLLDLSTLTAGSTNASDWIFRAQVCCTPAPVDNLPTLLPISTSCGLNNLDFPNGNDAPFWTDRWPNRAGHTLDTIYRPGIKTICSHRLITFPQGVTEYQNDSLWYEFIPVLGINGAPLPYAAPYSFANPLPLLIPYGMNLNSLNGDITLMADSPATAQANPPDMYVMAIKAREYRSTVGGIKKEIGFVTRTFLLMVEPDGTCRPDSLALVDDGKTLNIGCEKSIPITTTHFVECASIDQDASFILLVDSSTGLPIYVDSVSYHCQSPGVRQFNLHLLTPLPTGEYFLTLRTGKDGNAIVSECGDVMTPLRDTIRIHVVQEPATVLGSPDLIGGNLTYINMECGTDSLEITFSEPIQCSSLSTNGSDFRMTDASNTMLYPIDSASIKTCSGNLATKAILYFSAPLLASSYRLRIQQGSDGNTLINDCNQQSSTSSIISVSIQDKRLYLGPDRKYCHYDTPSYVLDASALSGSYQWNTGEISSQITVDTAGIYSVIVDNGFGCLAMDTVVITEENCTVGIENKAVKEFSIYPNPTTGQLFIEYPDNYHQVEVLVFDAKGKEVMKSTLSSAQLIDISNQPKGIYVVQVRAKESIVASSKIVLK